MKLLTVVGARPQFVKAATVSRALRERPEHTEVLVHTGQHYDENMSAVFFAELDIPAPDHNLGVGSGTHAEQTGLTMIALEPLIADERPDWLLVYGDTNATLAAALAAAKLHVRVAHVEAGLRSFNRRMPEEVNRVLTDHVSDLLLTPTATASAQLLREGIEPGTIVQVGDVMYDAALYYGRRAEGRAPLAGLGLDAQGGYVLATVHRAENTDDPERLRAILAGLGVVAGILPVVVPLHPRTRLAVRRHALSQLLEPLAVVEPLGYLDMVAAQRGARAIVTDSGGVQKEAYFFGVPCVTVRDETEWVETLGSGWNRLVTPLAAERLAEAVAAQLEHADAPRPAHFGTGSAADEVVAALARAS